LNTSASLGANGSVIEFDERDTALLNQSAVKAQLDLGVLRVSGSDAISFLHAQFSADCRMLTGRRVVTAWCTPKGRVLYLPALVGGDDCVYIVLSATQVDAFIRRLRLYVLRAAVEITDLRASHGVLMLVTPDGSLPPAYFSNASDSGWASSADGRHWLIAPHTQLAELWPTLGAAAVGANAVRLIGIRSREPVLEPATSELFLPQELDLDETGGVSFEKGCYPGQEIVARVRYRGQVKRRLARLKGNAENLPVAGTRILSDAEAHVGTVLYAAYAQHQTLEMLAVLDLDAHSMALTVEGSAMTIMSPTAA
jgi:tRNA-modifying protein YgfZ